MVWFKSVLALLYQIEDMKWKVRAVSLI